MANTKYGIILTCIIHGYIVLSLESSIELGGTTEQQPTLCTDRSCGKDCSPGQCKEDCVESDNHRPEFTNLSYTFEFGHPSSNSSENVIGKVTAEDMDDVTTNCGKVNYFASLERSPIPIQLDEDTGEIKVKDWGGFEAWPDTYEFNVTAHNPGQISYGASTATVTLIRRNTSAQDPSQTPLRRTKRSTTQPPTEITFSMTKTGDAAASEMCIGCSWQVQLVLGLPSGNQQPVVELFGASDDTTAHGYVRNVVLLRKGNRITSDVVISTNEISKNPNFGVTHMAVNLGSITVDNTAGTSHEDFQIVLQYEMGLDLTTTAPVASKLTGGAGALLSETLWIGVLNVQVAAKIDPEIEITNCPATVYPGDVVAIDVRTYLPFASGDYEIEVNSITPAVSIQHVALQPGSGFSSSLNISQTRIIDVQDSLVLGKTIRTKITGANNVFAGDTNQKAESGIRITAYVQVSPFASTRTFVSIYAHLPDGSSEMRTCVSNIKLDALGFTENGAQLQLPTIGPATETEKIVNTHFRVTIPSNTKQAYSIITEVGDVPGVELGHVTVTSGIATIPTGLQLLTSFTRSGDNHMLLKAQTYLGTIHNTNASASEITLQMSVKLRTDNQLADNTPVPLTASLNWEGGEQAPHSFSITPTGKSTPTQSIVPEKQPEIIIEKFQPMNDNQTVKYATVFLMKAKFASELVYMPVTFRLEFNSNDVKLLDSRFESIDQCLESIIPVGLQFTPNGNAYELHIPSIYVSCQIAPQEGWVSFRFVVSTLVENAYRATAKVLVNTLEFSHFVDITVLAFTSPSALTGGHLPMMDIFNASMAIPTQDSFIYPAVNLLFATVTLQPGTKETYELEMSSSDNTIGKLCHPRLLNFDSKIGFEPKEPSETGGITKTEIGYVFYQDKQIDRGLGTMFGRHTISYVLPLRILKNQQVIATANLKHGSLSVTKTFNTPATVVQINPTKKDTVQSGKLELFDFSPRSTYSVSESVAPGEPVKFYYTIRIAETKCARYAVTVTNPTGGVTWPVELSGIYLHSYGASIWCLDAVPTVTSQKSTMSPFLTTELTMVLGEICSHGTTDSWVRMLIYARPWWNHPGGESITNTIERSVEVKVLEDGITNPQTQTVLPFTVDPKRTMAYLPSKSSGPASIDFDTAIIEGSPGRTASVTIKIHIPAAAKFPDSSVTVQCDAKSNPSQAECSIAGLKLISGTDLASITGEVFIPSITSTVDSGQLHKAVIDLGNLVHTGIHQSLHANLDDPGVLTVVADVKLADSAAANNDANIPVNVIVKLANQTVSNSVNILVKRTGAETMELELVSELLDSTASSTFGPGDSLQIRVTRTMKDTSQLECQEQTLQIHNGNIFTNVLIAEQSTGLPQFQHNAHNNDPRITEFKAGGFFFDQSAWVIFNMTVVPDLLLSGGKFNLNSALVIELICMANQRTSPAPTDGVGGRPARFVTIQQIPVGKPGSCMKSLGISNPTTIRDCQITSFSSADPNHRAPNIRYTSSVGWKPPVRSGEFARYRYVDILFGKMTAVKEIKVKLISDTNKVIKMDIYGTNDGRAYFFHEQSQVTYQDNLHGSLWLTSQLESRGLRLVVSEQQKENEEVTFTIDLWGCDEIVDDKSFDACNIAPHSLAAKGGFLPPPFIVEPRVFLYANGQFFFCDLILDPFVTFSRRKRCYRSEDATPIRWYDMGPTVSQVLTYLPAENVIFGIGSDGQSLVQSSDFGKQWLVINRSAYHVQVLGAASSVNATAVPWSIIPGKFDAATTGTSCTAYTSGNWYICYGGIYQNTKLLLDWNTKCPTFNPPRI